VGSVGPDRDPFPKIRVGTVEKPAWCDNPELYAVPYDLPGYENDRHGSVSRGFQVSGEEIIMKWQWQYATNTL
jgi:hypothetical protein